jgi:hypothetical protein
VVVLREVSMCIVYRDAEGKLKNEQWCEIFKRELFLNHDLQRKIGIRATRLLHWEKISLQKSGYFLPSSNSNLEISSWYLVFSLFFSIIDLQNTQKFTNRSQNRFFRESSRILRIQKFGWTNSTVTVHSTLFQNLAALLCLLRGMTWLSKLIQSLVVKCGECVYVYAYDWCL